ncbi:MAG TPA: hypothetical protein EYP17_00105 [Candidatus Latescibacteria bacterium]|nr:hypothetical protein [Candidatus Latescibacterota bacterium]
MGRYHVEYRKEPLWGKVYVLRDKGVGISAEVAPGVGFLWRSMRWEHPLYGPLELLYGAGDYGRVPIGGMSPVLFPVVGRLRLGDREGVYRYGGREYRIDTHGFAKDMPWGEDEAGEDEMGAFVRAVLREDEKTLKQYPFPFRFTLTYRLWKGTLWVEAEVESEGPFALGFHPYFPVPLAPRGRRRDCEVRVPVRTCWELEHLVPTGRKVPPAFPFAEGVSVEGEFDEVLTEIKPGEEGWWWAELRDKVADTGILVQAEAEAFSEVVIFSPEGAPFLCIEPWTAPPNYLNRGDIWDKGPYRLRARWQADISPRNGRLL